jgi:hypothetical protein
MGTSEKLKKERKKERERERKREKENTKLPVSGSSLNKIAS